MAADWVSEPGGSGKREGEMGEVRERGERKKSVQPVYTMCDVSYCWYLMQGKNEFCPR